MEGGLFCQVSPFTDSVRAKLIICRGIIVPGGFGHRGTEGMIAAVKWAREQKVPFLGICLGFQVAVVEWARHACGLSSQLLATCTIWDKADVTTQVRTLRNLSLKLLTPSSASCRKSRRPIWEERCDSDFDLRYLHLVPRHRNYGDYMVVGR
jgi:hypothetical protein